MKVAPAILAVLGAATALLPAHATDRPLWELGVGIGGLSLPHYRGSDQNHTWVLPVPYYVYRGEIFKADRDGARAVLFQSDALDFDISAAATAPTESKDSDARRGMSDLAATLELGPNLNWTVARGDGWKLDLRAPVRAALTLESNPRLIGWTATPNVNVDFANLGGSGWNLGLLAGPVFATRRFNGYFYDVAPVDVTAGRAAYRAGGGYGGAQFTTALSRRYENWWAGFFFKLDTVSGARFADSPLVRQRSNVSFGFAISRVLATSERQVSVAE